MSTRRNRRNRRRRDLRNRLELPGATSVSALGRLRGVVAPESASALDVVDAEHRAAIARAPGHVRTGLRLSFVAVVAVGLLSVLLVRLWSIQVIHAGTGASSQLADPTRTVKTPAPRGPILARDGEVLAGDKEELVVTLKTTLDDNTEPATRVASRKTEEDLAALIPGLSIAHIETQLDNEQYGPLQPVPVAEGITVDEADIIDENPSEFRGASVSQEYVRDYPQDDLAAQMIGYLGPLTCTSKKASVCAAQLAKYEKEGYQPTDTIGTSGLEYQYERYLRGKDGTEVVEVNPADVPQGTVSTTPPVQGDSVVLNLDLPLEQVSASALAAQIDKLRAGDANVGTGPVPADWGAVVVEGPKGQVLSMVSNPSYNDNEWVGGISEADYDALKHEEGQPLNDYALVGDQPPGSTFKLATATAALDDGIIDPTYEIDDTGSFPLPGQAPLTDSNGESFGPIDVSTALTVSSDVFFYTLGEDFWYQRAKYGETPIQDVAAEYGFGEPSGIDLPGEAPGQVDSPQLTRELHEIDPEAYPATQWYLGDNVEMAFGQGATLVTPLEEADAYATFADGGTRYAPEMAGAIVGPTGKLVKLIQPKVEGHVHLPASTYDAMLTGFEGAVQDTTEPFAGTAASDFVGFNFSKWDLAGKTGTADVAANSTKQPTAWFVAFGGPKNDPSERYTVAVEIDQAGYGADAAAPVADTIFKYLYAHGVPKLDLTPGG